MSNSIKDYRKMVEEPWGRMFYDLIYRQLNIEDDKRKKILDFGAGFCITSSHYAKRHDVTAVEPNEEMYSMRFPGDYNMITEGIEYIKNIDDNSFDFVFCHNVLEYTDDKENILKELLRVLKPGGTLSIIKHNLYGRVMGSAVLSDNPSAALDLLSDDNTENSMFGSRSVYDNKYLIDLFEGGAVLKKTYGIRAFFGLSSNNEIKYTDEWYQKMLELENKASEIDEFVKIAFFNHLIFNKSI